jgi:hypothetical protein
MASVLTFLERYHKVGDEFLNHVVRVTCDETWVSFMNVETKEQSEQWMHTHLPNMPKKFKQMLSARKLMTTIFWVRKGVLMVEFMATRDHNNITSVLRNTKKTAKGWPFRKKRRGMLTYGVVLFHYNSHPHTAARTRALLKISTGSCLTTILQP